MYPGVHGDLLFVRRADKMPEAVEVAVERFPRLAGEKLRRRKEGGAVAICTPISLHCRATS